MGQDYCNAFNQSGPALASIWILQSSRVDLIGNLGKEGLKADSRQVHQAKVEGFVTQYVPVGPGMLCPVGVAS